MKNKSLNLKTKQLFKKAVSFITAVVMAAMLIPFQPVTAFAADAHSHPVCGAAHSDIGDHTGSCESIVWTGISAVPAETVAGNYYLTADITLTQTWTIPENTAVNLCLNGHSISGNDSVQVIHISEGATLSLCDCSTAGTGKITNGLAKQNAAGSLYNAGGGICVNKGTLNIYGGSITDNRTDNFQAGGVNVYGGTLRMYGGTISGNTAAGSGGGVWISDYIDIQPSEFNMYGGTISGNTAGMSGGGVYIIGSIFNMHGGTISDNTAETSGGGVWLQYLSATISGGTISGNKADLGSGIFLVSKSTLYLSGSPVIENNTRKGSSGENYELYKKYNVAATDEILDNVIITAPLTDGAVIPYANYKTGDIVAKGTDSYTVTASDMAKFGIPADAAYQKVLDSTNNRIVLGHNLADGGTVSLEQNVIQYDGTSHKPLVLVTYNDQPLAENTHYTVIWPDDTTNAGDKTVTVQGIFGANDSYYVGTLQSTYIITPKPVTPAVNGINDSYCYTGAPIKPAVTVTEGETVFTEGTDYTVIYGSNTTVSEGGTVKVEMKGNYSGSSEKTFAITKATPDLSDVQVSIPDNKDAAEHIEFAGNAKGADGSAVSGRFDVTTQGTLAYGENSIDFTFTPDDTENYNSVSAAATVTVTDTLKPEASVTLGSKVWSTPIPSPADEKLFLKTPHSVVLGIRDKHPDKLYYYISPSPVSDSEITEWTEYTQLFSISSNGNYIVYVKATDIAGNTQYINSGMIVYDDVAPVIEGITEGTTYYTTQKFTVTDVNTDTVTVNGSAVTEGNYILEGNTDKEYVVVATDKAGNSTTVTVQMKPLSTLSGDIEDVSAENITDTVIENLENVKDLLENAMSSEVTTAAEKTEAQGILDKISTLADNITVDYKIIHGADGSWTQSSALTLGFTADGAFSQFKEVRIADAQGNRTTLVRDTDYTAQSGSTIVTLKQSYLETLSVGEYKLEVVYDILGTEHIAECSFTVKAKPAPTPAPTATPEPTPTPAATKKPAQKVTAKPTATPEPTETPVEENKAETGTANEAETGDGQQDETETITPQTPAESTSFPILPVIIAVAAIAAVMIIIIILKKKKEDEE